MKKITLIIFSILFLSCKSQNDCVDKVKQNFSDVKIGSILDLSQTLNCNSNWDKILILDCYTPSKRIFKDEGITILDDLNSDEYFYYYILDKNKNILEKFKIDRNIDYSEYFVGKKYYILLDKNNAKFKVSNETITLTNGELAKQLSPLK